METPATRIVRQFYRDENATLEVSANWTEASSSIWARWTCKAHDDADWFATPFQVADANHIPRLALSLIKNWQG